MRRKKWFLINKKADFMELGRKFCLDPVIMKIIRNKNIEKEEEINKFLHGGIDDLYSPYLLKDIDLLTDILIKKIKENKKIRIIGDYDIDGIQSTYILKKGIERIGGQVSAAIPDRITDGYGINENLIRNAKQDGIDTIITCDNGISAIDAIAYAKENGMTVLVTDHHDIPYSEAENERIYLRSEADAIVNPKQLECNYPMEGICGAVVAWKVVLVLYDKCKIPKEEGMKFLENAAFATVGDVMDIVDENRIIVKYGLERMRHTENKGMQALMKEKSIMPETLNAYHFGFVLGPCLNASGRLDTAVKALKLMLTENEKEAYLLAKELSELNEQRKDMTLDGFEQAKRQIEENNVDKDDVMIIYLPDLHESLAGIVAGRIRELYNKPVFVLTNAEDGVKGSGRSIEAYSMFEEMNKCKDVFQKFGGHPMAAGLSLEKDRVEEFRTRMNRLSTLKEEDFFEKVQIDCQMPLNYVTETLITNLNVLEPFGKGNTKPVFAEKNIKILNEKILGKNKNVLKMTLMDNSGDSFQGIYFGSDIEEVVEYIHSKENFSITYYPQINEYMGNRTIQFVINDFC